MIYMISHDHGKMIVYNRLEEKANIENGWKTVDKGTYYNHGRSDGLDDLRKQYEEKTGKKPHHMMKRETMENALADRE